MDKWEWILTGTRRPTRVSVPKESLEDILCTKAIKGVPGTNTIRYSVVSLASS